MIKTKKDLRFYLREDVNRNGVNSRLKYWITVCMGHENACAYRYIKCMRFLEYHINNSSKVWNKICSYVYKVKLMRLGRRYGIQISPNTCGYGLRLMHLSGGRRNFIEYQKGW